jgi:hypothetical protein
MLAMPYFNTTLNANLSEAAYVGFKTSKMRIGATTTSIYNGMETKPVNIVPSVFGFGFPSLPDNTEQFGSITTPEVFKYISDCNQLLIEQNQTSRILRQGEATYSPYAPTSIFSTRPNVIRPIRFGTIKNDCNPNISQLAPPKSKLGSTYKTLGAIKTEYVPDPSFKAGNIANVRIIRRYISVFHGYARIPKYVGDILGYENVVVYFPTFDETKRVI